MFDYRMDITNRIKNQNKSTRTFFFVCKRLRQVQIDEFEQLNDTSETKSNQKNERKKK